jgi:hypothetical protein
MWATLHSVLTFCLLLVSAICIAGNLGLIIRYCVRGEHGSPVPLVGGIFGAIGLAFSHFSASRYWYLPLILDPSCAWLAILALRSLIVK